MRYLWLVPGVICLLAIVVMAATQTSQTAGLTVDRIYSEIVLPLEHDNFQLRLEVMALNDRIQLLEKELAEIKKPSKP